LLRFFKFAAQLETMSALFAATGATITVMMSKALPFHSTLPQQQQKQPMPRLLLICFSRFHSCLMPNDFQTPLFSNTNTTEDGDVTYQHHQQHCILSIRK
jgi:hypothetical protein